LSFTIDRDATPPNITAIKTSKISEEMWKAPEEVDKERATSQAKAAVSISLKAAEEGNVAKLKEQIDSGLVFSNCAALSLPWQLFTTALEHNHPSIIAVLLEAWIGDTPLRPSHRHLLIDLLMMAIEQGRDEIVLALTSRLEPSLIDVEFGASIDCIVRLMKSAKTGFLSSTTEQAIEGQSQWIYQNPLVNLCELALMTAAEAGNWTIVELLVKNAPKEALATYSCGPARTAAIAAAKAQKFDIIHRILENCGPSLPYGVRIDILDACPDLENSQKKLSSILTLNSDPEEVEIEVLKVVLRKMRGSQKLSVILQHMRNFQAFPEALDSALTDIDLDNHIGGLGDHHLAKVCVALGITMSALCVGEYLEMACIENWDSDLIERYFACSKGVPQLNFGFLLEEAVKRDDQKIVELVVAYDYCLEGTPAQLKAIIQQSKSEAVTTLLKKIQLPAPSEKPRNNENHHPASTPQINPASQTAQSTLRKEGRSFRVKAWECWLGVWGWVSSVPSALWHLPSRLWQRCCSCFG
jgi:hypothetical protein